jgi:hypothetical protein
MKLKDRLLIVRRSLLIALNPRTDGVYYKTIQKGGSVKGNLIFTDKEKATSLYEADLVDLFANGCEPTSELLTKRIKGFCLIVQKHWNAKNPNDPVEFVKEE